jgi:hypothetical protein
MGWEQQGRQEHGWFGDGRSDALANPMIRPSATSSFPGPPSSLSMHISMVGARRD